MHCAFEWTLTIELFDQEQSLLLDNYQQINCFFFFFKIFNYIIRNSGSPQPNTATLWSQIAAPILRKEIIKNMVDRHPSILYKCVWLIRKSEMECLWLAYAQCSYMAASCRSRFAVVMTTANGKSCELVGLVRRHLRQ